MANKATLRFGSVIAFEGRPVFDGNNKVGFVANTGEVYGFDAEGFGQLIDDNLTDAQSLERLAEWLERR